MTRFEVKLWNYTSNYSNVDLLLWFWSFSSHRLIPIAFKIICSFLFALSNCISSDLQMSFEDVYWLLLCCSRVYDEIIKIIVAKRATTWLIQNLLNFPLKVRWSYFDSKRNAFKLIMNFIKCKTPDKTWSFTGK